MDKVQESVEKLQELPSHYHRYARLYQNYLDKTVPRVRERWAAEGALLVVFLLRVVLAHGWYVVCYALAIYLLNMFLGFLSPKFDPQTQDDMRASEAEEGLPTTTQEAEEFRPFIRRLPEFQFWYLSIRGTVIALLSTVTRATDVPVFWPILVVYFVTLFVLTMKRQIQHMIQYRYLPFDIGKKRFGRP